MAFVQTTTQDYISTLFNGHTGYLVSANIDETGTFTQKHIKTEEFLKSKCYHGKENYFITMNTLKSTQSRSAGNVLNATSFFVDVDAYKDGMTPEDILDDLMQNAFDVIVPMPTFVVFSGNGLYLIWPIELTSNVSKWAKIENNLVEALSAYGADLKVKDAARILRIPGTINAKPNCGKEVKVFRMRDKDNDRFTLSEIEQFLPKSTTQIKKVKNIAKKVNNTAKKDTIQPIKTTSKKKPLLNQTNYQRKKEGIKKENKPISKYKIKKANNAVYEIIGELPVGKTALARAADIIRVMMFHGVKCEGFREVALFYIRHFLQVSGYSENKALECVLKFNSMLARPLSEKEVINATYADSTQKYRPSNETLIDFFAISEQMQAQLTTIVSYEYRTMKRKISERRILSRNEKMQLGRTRASAMYAQGYSVVQICKELHISKTAFYKNYYSYVLERKRLRATMHYAMVIISIIKKMTDNIESIFFLQKKESTFCMTFKEKKEHEEKNLISLLVKIKYLQHFFKKRNLVFLLQRPKASKTFFFVGERQLV